MCLTTREIPCAHVFKSTVDPMSTCGLESRRTLHYLLRCNLYFIEKLEHLNNVCILNPCLRNYSNEKLLNTLLYGSEDITCNIKERNTENYN